MERPTSGARRLSAAAPAELLYEEHDALAALKARAEKALLAALRFGRLNLVVSEAEDRWRPVRTL
jgi:hypothetical protein